MTYKIQTTNTPVDDNGKGELVEVEEHEFLDLYRMGLVVKGQGDVQEDGTLRPKAAKTASPSVQTLTGQIPTTTSAGSN